jgi:hypothetical protein
MDFERNEQLERLYELLNEVNDYETITYCTCDTDDDCNAGELCISARA